MNELGLVIKQLQRKQSLNGQELAKRIGITPPNLSQIVNGHAKPRQGTFTNLCKELGKDKVDEKLLVDAFLRVKEGTPETVAVDSEEYQKTEVERAEHFLEMKAQSIAFKRSVARELGGCNGVSPMFHDFLVLSNFYLSFRTYFYDCEWRGENVEIWAV